MFRNIQRFSRSSIQNYLIANKLVNNLKIISSNITLNIKNKKSLEQSKHFAIYFYKLVTDFYGKGINYNQIKSDPIYDLSYIETLKILENENGLELQDKLSILRSLQIIGVPSDDELICKLIENLNTEISKCPLDKALKVLLNQVQFQETSLQKIFTKNLIELIESKLEEVSNLQTVLLIFNEKITNLFSKEFINQVDLKAIQLSKSINESKPLVEEELTWILHKLSLTKRRPKPLIQFLTNALSNGDLSQIEFNKILSLVSSLANLNYLSLDLMSKIDQFLISNQFQTKINKFDFNLLLKNYIKLRYSPIELFDYLGDNIEILNDRLGKKCLMNLISTMAFFNYSIEKANILLNNQVFKEIDIDLIKDTVILFEYLWSLAFYDNLDKAPIDQLTLNFYTKVLDKKYFYYLKPRFALLYNYCKLNLGLDVNIPDKYFQQNLPSKESSLKTDDFLLILKKENYLTHVDTDLGYRFDLVLVCNKDFKTIPIKNLEQAKKSCNDEYKLIFIYFLNLKEVALNTSQILGEIKMMKDIGKKLNYEILLINPYDFLGRTSLETVKEFRKQVTDLFKLS